MLRVGVVSDSHGEVENLLKAACWLVDEQRVEVLIHLGDDYDDTHVLEDLGVRVIRVPGVFSSYYQDDSVQNRVVERFGDWRVLISHTDCSHENDLPDDVRPEDLLSENSVDVVFFGHSHIPFIDRREGVLFVNPGHLKTEDKKGYPPSMAVVDFQKQIHVDIFDLNGVLIKSEKF